MVDELLPLIVSMHSLRCLWDSSSYFTFFITQMSIITDCRPKYFYKGILRIKKPLTPSPQNKRIKKKKPDEILLRRRNIFLHVKELYCWLPRSENKRFLNLLVWMPLSPFAAASGIDLSCSFSWPLLWPGCPSPSTCRSISGDGVKVGGGGVCGRDGEGEQEHDHIGTIQKKCVLADTVLIFQRN